MVRNIHCRKKETKASVRKLKSQSSCSSEPAGPLLLTRSILLFLSPSFITLWAEYYPSAKIPALHVMES